jgi:hypothetical protein
MSDMFDKLAMMRLIEDNIDAEDINRLARDNGHSCPLPTHKVVKAGQIVGAVSMGIIPVVLAWQHTELVNARDSINLLAVTESLMSQKFTTWLMPCSKTSPYYSLMTRFGYQPGGDFTLFFKQPSTKATK